MTQSRETLITTKQNRVLITKLETKRNVYQLKVGDFKLTEGLGNQTAGLVIKPRPGVNY